MGSQELCHRLHVACIQLIQGIDIVKNRIQIAQQVLTLLGSQLQMGKLGHVGNIGFANFHDGMDQNLGIFRIARPDP